MLATLLTAAFSAWYASAGQFPNFPFIQNDYVDLGDAFLHGQLELREQPDPRLALLGNPYDYNQRRDIPVHWDASYYDNKYYLYWGPAPGVVSAAIQAVTGQAPSGSVLVLIPYLGLLAVSLGLLVNLPLGRSALRRATVGMFVLIGFFSFPMLYTLGQPRHYQASILFGQFFLLGGLLCFVRYTRSQRAVWLIATGVGWGLALASRYNLAISICVFLGGACWWLWKNRKEAALAVRGAALAGAFLLCVIGLGIYNLARFGNALETGLTYQLTIPELREMSYARAYVPSGLYVYFIYPMTSSPTFPFIQAWHFSPRNLPEWLYIPKGRTYDQVIFGLLGTVPGVWLGLLAIPAFIVSVVRSARHRPRPESKDSTGLVFSMLALASAGQVVFLLVFFYLAERYLVDFYVPLVLCLAMLLWWLDERLQALPGLRVSLWAVAGVLAVWTMAVAYFACFGVPTLVSGFFDASMVGRAAAFWNRYLPAAGIVIRALP